LNSGFPTIKYVLRADMFLEHFVGLILKRCYKNENSQVGINFNRDYSRI